MSFEYCVVDYESLLKEMYGVNMFISIIEAVHKDFIWKFKGDTLEDGFKFVFI